MITAGDKYFYKDGEIFPVVGHSSGIERFDYPDDKNESYFVRMANSKQNVLRILLDHPKYIEPTIGEYDEFDYIFERLCFYAKKYDIWLLPVVYFPHALNWGNHSYNSRNGGPIHVFWQFFDLSVYSLVKNRLTYLLTKYNNENIFSWEITNEIHIDDVEWVDTMVDHCRQYTDKLLSVSIPNVNTQTSNWNMWKHEKLDFVSFHPYYSESPDLRLAYGTFSGSASEVFNKRIENVGYIMEEVKRRMGNNVKPILDTETPMTPLNLLQKIVNWRMMLTPNSQFEKNFFDVNKEYLINDAAGGGLTWNNGIHIAGHLHPLSIGQENYQKELYDFFVNYCAE